MRIFSIILIALNLISALVSVSLFAYSPSDNTQNLLLAIINLFAAGALFWTMPR